MEYLGGFGRRSPGNQELFPTPKLSPPGFFTRRVLRGASWRRQTLPSAAGLEAPRQWCGGFTVSWPDLGGNPGKWSPRPHPEPAVCDDATSQPSAEAPDAPVGSGEPNPAVAWPEGGWELGHLIPWSCFHSSCQASRSASPLGAWRLPGTAAWGRAMALPDRWLLHRGNADGERGSSPSCLLSLPIFSQRGSDNPELGCPAPVTPKPFPLATIGTKLALPGFARDGCGQHHCGSNSCSFLFFWQKWHRS